jgi:hypothetical protein
LRLILGEKRQIERKKGKRKRTTSLIYKENEQNLKIRKKERKYENKSIC